MVKKIILLNILFNISVITAMVPQDPVQDFKKLETALQMLYTELQKLGASPSPSPTPTPSPPPLPRDPDKSISVWQKELEKHIEFPSYQDELNGRVTTAVPAAPGGSPYKTLETLFNNVAQLAKNKMNSRTLWIDGKNPNLSLYDINQNLNTNLSTQSFQPYVQKVLVPNDAEFAIFGDIHGSAHSLVRSLQNLIFNKFLNDDWRLSNNKYLIFVGDYVDGGKYGIEVLFTLALLKLKNFDNVFIIRGNHEDPAENERTRPNRLNKSQKIKYAFGRELDNKLNLAANPQEKKIFYNFFDLLPLGLFIGDKKGNNFILFCHGAPEIGFDPKILTEKTNQSVRYQLIENVQRSLVINQLQLSQASPGILTQDFKPTSLEGPPKLGFTWGDFYLRANPSFPYTGEKAGAPFFSYDATKALIDLWNKKTGKNIMSIIRGHQHGPTDYPELWSYPQDRSSTIPTAFGGTGFLRLWDGLLYILFAGPANYSPEYPLEYSLPMTPYNGEYVFPYDSFITLKKSSPNNWEISTYWRPHRDLPDGNPAYFQKAMYSKQNIPLIGQYKP